MPYLHRDLGVKCITQAEFWESQAKAEGRDSTELICEYLEDISREEARAAKDLLEDKDGALKMLKSYYDPEICECEFIPTQVLEVLTSSVYIGTRATSSEIKAVAMCNDNKVRTFKYKESNFHGSYMDPPDFESSCEVVE